MRVLFRLPRWALLVGFPLLIVAALVAVWGIDTAMHGGKIARNNKLGDESVGGLSDEELTQRVEDRAVGLGLTPIMIRTIDGEIQLTASELGVAVDVDATVDAALRSGREGGLSQPLSWLASFAQDNTVELEFVVDLDQARSRLHSLEALRTAPTAPGVRFDGSVLEVVPGTPGQGIDVEDVISKLPAAVDKGGSPIVIDAELAIVPAATTAADLISAVAEANEIIDNELTLQVNAFTAPLSSRLIASWFEVDVSGEEPVIEIDTDRILPDLEKLMAGGATGGGTAVFNVDEGEVEIVSSDGGTTCCDFNAPFVVLRAINNGLTEEPVVLPTRPASPREGLEELQSLGVTDLVGSFTTNHACCQSRVTNIQRFADLVRGAVILPGESLSLNDHVGRRTRENGFVSGGFISKGVLVSDIGGGVSQFATTMFNAGFFAGLDFDEYQAHSIYFSRYPYGREATISFPDPDLVIRNTSEYAVLVWTSYTSTSITVDMYSTKHIEVLAHDPVTTFQGQCRRATTRRTRTYTDGQEVVDSFFAVYRPGEGKNCDGSASDPSSTTTTTTIPTTTVPAETTAPTTAAPTTAAPTTAAPTTAAPTTAAP